ncbi:UNVERIFIED_CONTAM: hypothetical protein FKN15_074412 [Acipenser sinensis]
MAGHLSEGVVNLEEALQSLLYFTLNSRRWTALARFRQAQLEDGKVKERRPFLASECNELPKAERWRRQIISEISKKVAQIQNAGLGEFKIRDLNDEINKLLREKGHWETRIKELGGPDYARVGPRMLDHEGKEVPGNRGYKYFGAAKDLPGVRELFEKEPLPPPRKTRAELMKDIDAEYYGYRDEDDGVLVPLEQEYEKRGICTEPKLERLKLHPAKSCHVSSVRFLFLDGAYREHGVEVDTARVRDKNSWNNLILVRCQTYLTGLESRDQKLIILAEAVERWKAEKEAHLAGEEAEDKEEVEEEEYIYAVQEDESDEETGEPMEGEEGSQKFIAHVPVPSQKEIEEALVRRKKMELLQKYASETLMAQSEEAKTLLGL